MGTRGEDFERISDRETTDSTGETDIRDRNFPLVPRDFVKEDATSSTGFSFYGSRS